MAFSRDVEIRATVHEDWRTLERNIRPSDAAEAIATFGLSPNSVVWLTRKSSDETHSGFVGGVLVCMFGVGPEDVLTGIRRPWLIGTRELDKQAGIFARRSLAMIGVFMRAYPRLVNHVDARNRRTVRWLRSLGFVIDEPEPFGALGLPFHRFSYGVT